jgi:uncharacterized surface protein with fasciclin (FAS1) repeats
MGSLLSFSVIACSSDASTTDGGAGTSAEGGSAGSGTQGGSGGSDAGAGGSTAGSGGAKAGSGGTTAGSGGTTAGSGGTTAGSGGSTAGAGGAAAGAGGAAAGAGGDAAGAGGAAAGAGGDAAGAAGAGGDAAGAAGAGGDAAGAAGAGGAAGGAAGAGGAPPPPTKNIPDTAAADPQFSTLVDLLGTAGLVDALKGDGPFTVFAPTNDAFDKFLSDTKLTVDDLKKAENKQLLTDILSYHVSSDPSTATPATKGLYAQELIGLADVSSLLSPTAKTSFLDVSFATDPNDPTSVIGLFVGQGIPLPFYGTATTVDVGATNGVIHVIDRVLVPPKYASFSDPIAFDAKSTKTNLIDLLTYYSTVGFDYGNGNGVIQDFKTLTALATKCQLVDTLKAAKDITVFAPTDAAFAAAKIDATADCAVVGPVLKYHVVTSVAPASAALAAASSGAKLDTLQGKQIGFKIDKDKGLLVDDGSAAPPAIAFKNVQTGNALVHAIDGVLTPPK